MAAPISLEGCVEVPHAEIIQLLPGGRLYNADTGESVDLRAAVPAEARSPACRDCLAVLAAEAAGSSDFVSLQFGGTAKRACLVTASGQKVWVNSLLAWSAWADSTGRRFAWTRTGDSITSHWRSDLEDMETEYVTDLEGRTLCLVPTSVVPAAGQCRYFWLYRNLLTDNMDGTTALQTHQQRSVAGFRHCTDTAQYQELGFTAADMRQGDGRIT